MWQEQTPLGQHSMSGGSPVLNSTKMVQERVDQQVTTINSWFCGLADSPYFDLLHPSSPNLDTQTPIEDWDLQVFWNGAGNMIARQGASKSDIWTGTSSLNSISPAFGAIVSWPGPQEVNLPTYTDHSPTNIHLCPSKLVGELVLLAWAFQSKSAPPDTPRLEPGIFVKPTPQCLAHDNCQSQVPSKM